MLFAATKRVVKQKKGKFPNFEEGDPNKGFQALNEDNEPRRFCYERVVAIEAE